MKTNASDHITADDFENRVKASPVPVLVYFYRKLCHGCQQLAPAIDTLFERYEREGTTVQVFRCDDAQVMRRVKVFFVPQLVLFYNGRDVWIERKINTPESIREEISRILAKPS